MCCMGEDPFISRERIWRNFSSNSRVWCLSYCSSFRSSFLVGSYSLKTSRRVIIIGIQMSKSPHVGDADKKLVRTLEPIIDVRNHDG